MSEFIRCSWSGKVDVLFGPDEPNSVTMIGDSDFLPEVPPELNGFDVEVEIKSLDYDETQWFDGELDRQVGDECPEGGREHDVLMVDDLCLLNVLRCYDGEHVQLTIEEA